MKEDFIVVIPARYASERLPGKPLLEIAGKPMIQHVYEKALASGAKKVVVATDDQRILSCVESFGGNACLTADDHISGTDRIHEAACRLRCESTDILVNVQGDEPLIPPTLIRQVASALKTHSTADMATICEQLTEIEQVFDPNCVKVVRNNQGFALYFSRAPIPWDRAAFPVQVDNATIQLTNHQRHIGIYAYRYGFLEDFVTWQPSLLEQMESLEQLRALAYGKNIYVDQVDKPVPKGVDTQQDLERVCQNFARLVVG